MKIAGGENTQLLKPDEVTSFQEMIWNFYHLAGRSFPWRNVNDPYRVMISEIMLQQTQTYRVLPKYEQFIHEFSSFHSLAAASLRDVLSVWQGLGYNRRGKLLHEASQIIVTTYGGRLPDDQHVLVTLPGIGPATAASVSSFAFNKPTVFIETNIRSVFIHSFFSNEEKVSDRQIMPLVAQTLDHRNPREWYYALMDYGVMLKKKCFQTQVVEVTIMLYKVALKDLIGKFAVLLFVHLPAHLTLSIKNFS